MMVSLMRNLTDLQKEQLKAVANLEEKFKTAENYTGNMVNVISNIFKSEETWTALKQVLNSLTAAGLYILYI